MRKQERKLIICCCFARGEKPPKPYQKNGKDNQMLIENREKKSDSSGLKA